MWLGTACPDGNVNEGLRAAMSANGMLGSDGGRRRPALAVVFALALVALGAGALLVSSALYTGGSRVVGANAPISAGAEDQRDITANNSPAVARNPVDAANLAVVNRVDTPSFSCALHVSRDAGATWSQTRIPFPDGEELPERCFAPDVAFAADGTLHASFVTLKGQGNVPNALWVARSDDGGETLAVPVRASGPLAFQARLLADAQDPGRLYLSWLQADAVGTLAFPNTGNPVVIARSDDGGATWNEPVRVSDSSRDRVLAPSLAAGPDGEVYALYLDVGEDRLDYHGGHEGRGGNPYPGPWSLVLARSDDAAASWQETVVADDVVPTQRLVAFFPPFPSLAADQRGRVYVAFQHGELGDPDVWLWASEDGGETFGRARRVNDTPRRDATAQYLPALAVAPNGRLDVVYYDRRADPSNYHNEVSLQSSSDGGDTFGPRLRLSDQPFDSRVGFGSERGLPDLGSRLAVVSTDRAALAIWTDTRLGTQASNKQVLARAVVSHPSAAAAALLRSAGLVAVLAGLVILAWWVATRPGRHDAARTGGTSAPLQVGGLR